MKLNNKSGVTLLELLIAMSLAIMILLILFSAMRLSSKSQEKGLERAELTQKVRIIGDRITWLIRGAYPFILKKPDEQKLYFLGEPDRIGFVTTSIDIYGTGPEDTAGLKWISIYEDGSELKMREKVYFLEDVFEDSGGKEYTFIEDIRSLEFEYYDLPEGEDEGEWVSDWDSDEKEYLPSAVKVNLSFEHSGKTVAIPEIIANINAYTKEVER
jgi:general secretion pathway protein J